MTTKQKQKQTNKSSVQGRKKGKKEKITENLHTSPGKDGATRPRVQVQDY